MKSSVPTLSDVVEANSLFDEKLARSIFDSVGEPTWRSPDDYPEAVALVSSDPLAAVMASQLSWLAFNYRLAARRQSQSKHGKIEKRVRKVGDAARQLLEALTDDNGIIQDDLGGGALFAFAANDGHQSGAQRVAEVADAVRDLKRWSLAAADMFAAQHSAEPPPIGRKRDTAFHDLIEGLCGVYYFHWGKRPGFSRPHDGGLIYGPFVRFLSSTLSVVLPDRMAHTGDEAIASIIAEHRWPPDRIG